MAALSVPTFQLFETLRQELEDDAELRARRDVVATGVSTDDWLVRDGLLLHKGRVFVPASSAVLDDVL